MELFSPVFVTDGRRERLRQASVHLGVRATKVYDWFSDKGRQLRSVAGNEALKRALFSEEKAPVEGTRLPIGERINIHHPDGSRTRLRICGVRSGGFSNAYTVIDLDEMKPYCLKENRALPGDEKKKNRGLSREAEMSMLLGGHPNLVTAFAAFHYRSRLYLLTEYLPDESLDLKLKRGPFPPSDAVTYAIQICRAMGHACAVLPGFVHGDIKPGNCMISGNGEVKLGDLGLSSAEGIGNAVEIDADAGNDRSTHARHRGWGGTALYMAPEMFDRDSPERSNADIYALGVTLYEMICGTRPFTHAEKSQLIEMHRSAEADFDALALKGAPPALIDLIRKCMAKSPARRPQSFAEVVETLSQIAENDLGLPPTPNSADFGAFPDPVRIAMSFAALERFDAAIAVADGAISLNGRSAELLAGRALVLAMASRLDDAYEASTAALMMRADLFRVLFAHARVMIALGDLESAANYLRRAHAMDKTKCVVLNLLGAVCHGIGEIEEAISFLKLSLMIDDSQPDALSGLAGIELTKGNFDAAIRHAQKALAVDPNHPQSNLTLAEAFAGSSRWVESVRAYKDALRHSPESKQIRKKFVAACLSVLGRSGEPLDVGRARLLMQSAKLLQEGDATKAAADRFTNRLIQSLYDGGEYGSELLFFNDLTVAKLAEGPGVPDPDELVEALNHIRECAGKRNELPYHLHHSVGRVLYHLDYLDDCEKLFAEMLDEFGPNESSYYYLGACAEIRADYSAALGYYRKANEILQREDFRTGVQRVSHQLKKTVSGTVQIH